FQAEDGIRDPLVTGVQTCALPICDPSTYTNWAGQPDNGHGSNEDCSYLDGLTGLWADDACSTTRRYFCEGPVGSSSLACGSSQRSEERRVGKGWWYGWVRGAFIDI